VGGEATLHNAYLLLQSFVESSGRQPAGPPREIYLTDPAEEPDETKWRTEVQWPLLDE
jgi:effector-binding domain-containing protein